jgi:arsenate reductase
MTTVLFACIHNAGRSQMAAAFFNRYADPTKARALSAGTHPGERVNPDVVEAIREQGHELDGPRPQNLSAEHAAPAQWLVTMGSGDECPIVPSAQRDDWPLEDPSGQSPSKVREIRDDVERRVRAFIAANGWA